MSNNNIEFQTLTVDSVKLISTTLNQIDSILKDQSAVNDAQSKINGLILEAIKEIKASLNNLNSKENS